MSEGPPPSEDLIGDNGNLWVTSTRSNPLMNESTGGGVKNGPERFRIWLVTVGEPLPIDLGNPRLQRTGMLAAELARRGHSVTWWTSSFDHFNRVQRTPGTSVIQLESASYKLTVLSGPGYKRNISLSRLIDHAVVAARFWKVARELPRPDVILSSLPTLELCEVVRRLASRTGAPYVVDVRDLWPDIFERSMPTLLRPVSGFLLSPYRWIARSVCRDASGIVGNTKSFVDWGLNYADRVARPLDNVIPFGYPVNSSIFTTQENMKFWKDQGVGPKNECVTFLGALSPQFEFDSTFAAATLLAETNPRLKFVICGNGSQLESLRLRAAGTPNVIVPGWIGEDSIRSLLRRSVIGLAPYIPNFDFKMSIPNKVAEYLSAGLPILTSLEESELARLLEKNYCGLVYPLGDGAALAKAIRAVLVPSDGLRIEMSLNATELFQRMFRADVVYGNFADHLERVAVGEDAN